MHREGGGDAVNVNVLNCSSCGGNHGTIVAIELKRHRPVGGFVWTHWLMCPDNAEPVCLRRRSTEEFTENPCATEAG